ncbi:MAG: type II 3-dehydroquinate dehydratase [Proteobacteria bacterium]|nr:type II 3-dehydroquinate dehydratase [Pseudomonadota bacterium]
MAMKLLLINGPNLNLLGLREPATYGHATLAEVERAAAAEAARMGAELAPWQSNHEGAIVERIHAAHTEGVAGIVINAGAYTHTSIAIRDALAATALPFVEVHISNVHAREPFRHRSYLSAMAAGIVVGFGVDGYRLAVQGLVRRLSAG